MRKRVCQNKIGAGKMMDKSGNARGDPDAARR
jgi:hypothetical protein